MDFGPSIQKLTTSKKVWSYPMKIKGEMFDIFKKCLVFVGRETEKVLKFSRKDNVEDYLSNE